ncbi:MAG: L-seryl-tRNA(Sec) selenium transferase [Candidatus Sericytochromatia bacterium]|nr:L-seryl-tRNA(Sec) selenium transferase [Candidatus Tanganyikabacteria bacterium]
MPDPSVSRALRALPAVGRLLLAPELAEARARHGEEAVAAAVREVLDDARGAILAGETSETEPMDWAGRVATCLARTWAPRLRRVVNGTGVVLNTNLGRAPLASDVVREALEEAAGYCNLEFDLASGDRGDRHSVIEEHLRRLTGAEAALVVNNNAAAVLLVVDGLAREGEVLISRGELVEIGGSFRIPEVVATSGAILREVGATNRTRLADFEAGRSDRTRLVMKCHTSNYRMEGFVAEVPRADLVAFGRKHGLPVVEDLGSGSLISLAPFGLPDEPTVPRVLAEGLDLVTFSGDKLLGGPQAGIIAGRRDLVDRLRRRPLLRAFRCDKVTLALLEATLRRYGAGLPPEATLPALGMLAVQAIALEPRALGLAHRLLAEGWPAEAVPTVSMPGGGALPATEVPSWAVRLTCPWGPWTEDTLATALRRLPCPVIGRLRDGAWWLDVRTLLPGDEDRVVAAFRQLAGGAA